MDHRIWKIRFWLSAVVICLLWLLLPWQYSLPLAIWPVALFSSCCCAGAVACVNCTAIPAQMQMIVSGNTDSDCTNCSDLDGTFALPHSGSASPCNWELRGSTAVSCGAANCAAATGDYYGVSVGRNLFTLDYILSAACGVTSSGDKLMYRTHNFGASKPDCTTINTAVATNAGADTCAPSGTPCDNPSLSITVQAL